MLRSIVTVARYTLGGACAGAFLGMASSTIICKLGHADTLTRTLGIKALIEGNSPYEPIGDAAQKSFQDKLTMIPLVCGIYGLIHGGIAGLIYGVTTEILKATNTQVRFTW